MRRVQVRECWAHEITAPEEPWLAGTTAKLSRLRPSGKVSTLFLRVVVDTKTTVFPARCASTSSATNTTLASETLNDSLLCCVCACVCVSGRRNRSRTYCITTRLSIVKACLRQFRGHNEDVDSTGVPTRRTTSCLRWRLCTRTGPANGRIKRWHRRSRANPTCLHSGLQLSFTILQNRTRKPTQEAKPPLTPSNGANAICGKSA